MTTRQSAELDHALERNGWTAEDVKKVSRGHVLSCLLVVVRDLGKVSVNSNLTLLRTERIAAQPVITTSKKYFEEAGVTLMGPDFESQFVDLEVAATPETEMAVRKLEKNSFNAPILVELGEKAVTSISQFREFLVANRKSRELFTFYLRGKDGNIWAVQTCWFAPFGGWRFHVSRDVDPYVWDVDNLVVSCN